MSLFKLGRLPAKYDQATFRTGVVLAKALDALGTPPVMSDNYVSAVAKLTGGSWGMMGNGPDPANPPGWADGLGDCTMADGGHSIMLWTANSGKMIQPTTPQVLAAYAACTGWNVNDPNSDQGGQELDVLAFMEKTGIAGQKIAAYGSISPINQDHLKWCVQIFGSCRLGIVVTDEMQEDFQNGKPWTNLKGQVEGGHDVPILYYDKEFAYVCTWDKAPVNGADAGLQPVSWKFLADKNFVDEAHQSFAPEWVSAGGTAPNKLNLQQLMADIKAVSN